MKIKFKNKGKPINATLDKTGLFCDPGCKNLISGNQFDGNDTEIHDENSYGCPHSHCPGCEINTKNGLYQECSENSCLMIEVWKNEKYYKCAKFGKLMPYGNLAAAYTACQVEAYRGG